MSYLKIFLVWSVVFFALLEHANAQTTTAFTLDTVDSQIQFNFGRSIAVGGSQILHQVWVEATQPHDDGSAEVTGRIMYRISPDGGVTWTQNKALTNVIQTGYPKVAAYGPYVFVTYHETIGSIPNVKLLYSQSVGTDWYQMAPQLPVPVQVSISNGSLPSVAAFGEYVHITYGSIVQSTSRSEVFYRGGQIVNSKLTWLAYPRMVSDSNGTQYSGDSKSSWTPDIAADGPNVFVTWTDERHHSPDCAQTGQMDECLEEVYYRRTDNLGKSWWNEIRLTNLSNGGAGSGHNASQIAASNGTVHIAIARKPENSIHYLNFPYSQVDPPPNNGIGTDIAVDSSTEFGRPAIAVQGSEVQIVFHEFIPNVGMNIYRTESTNGGVTFQPYQQIPAPVVSRQPSIAIDATGLTHLIFTGKLSTSGVNYQMYYGKW